MIPDPGKRKSLEFCKLSGEECARIIEFMNEVKVTPWPHGRQPTSQDFQKLYALEGMNPYRWSNRPHVTYSAHVHSFHKVIYVVSGSITFGLPELGESVTLQVGDRLDLPSGVVHDAVVGPQGVVCLEGHAS